MLRIHEFKQVNISIISKNVKHLKTTLCYQIYMNIFCFFLLLRVYTMFQWLSGLIHLSPVGKVCSVLISE